MTVTPEAQRQLDTILNAGEFLEVGLKGGGCGGATILLTKVDSKSTDALSIVRDYQRDICRQSLSNIFDRG